MKAPRKLKITTGGKWYLALTIVLGVVALSSGNNILYLIESLLLSALILSGYVSERIVSGVRVEITRKPASAGSPSRDTLVVKNPGKHPIFCVEISEYFKGRHELLAYLPSLRPGQTVHLTSRQGFQQRGVHLWDGIAISTSYPFGFARKIKTIVKPGQRLIWPQWIAAQGRSAKNLSTRQSRSLGEEMSEGEIRTFQQDDDYRSIVWSLSARDQEPVVRLRRSQEGSRAARLDLRVQSSPEFEEKVTEVAQNFYPSRTRVVAADDESGTLILTDWNGTRRIRGNRKALDQLAILKAAGTSSG